MSVSDVTDLLSTHPNDLTVQHTDAATPLHLVHAYTTGSFAPSIPPHIRSLIHHIRVAQLPRTPISISPSTNALSTQGMSPKKIHEVSRMAAYILSLTPALPSSLRIVDIGAGQGYLTRALKALLPNTHILALDADIAQTHAAQVWERRLLPNAHPPIDHRVVYISEENLLSTIDHWVGTAERVPVLFVALHACGSLTPDILRAYIRASQLPLDHPSWYPAALVAVGCCYNLMNPSDYPKSTLHLPMSAYHLAAQIPETWLIEDSDSSLKLDPAVSLAIRKVTWRALLGKVLESATPALPAKPDESANKTPNKSTTVPAHWSRRPRPSNPEPLPDQTTGIGTTPSLLRLGKLPSSAYSSWNAFLHHAGVKMALEFSKQWFVEDDHADGDTIPPSLQQLENDLAVHHVLRCLLGPVVESAILRERLAWVRKGLGIANADDEMDQDGRVWIGAGLDPPGVHRKMNAEETSAARSESSVETDSVSSSGQSMKAELVNLFDQRTGSGRNVAIVIAPAEAF